MRFILELIIMALAVMLAAYLVPGAEVTGFWSAFFAAILIAIVNTVIGGILRLLTFPINFLTLGLMSFVITVLMVMLVSSWMDGFEVDGFWSAAIFALVLAIIKMISGSLMDKEKE